MKTNITLQDVKSADVLNVVELIDRVEVATQARSSSTCSLALLIRNTPKEQWKKLQKDVYTTAKARSERVYNAIKNMWKDACQALHIGPVHKPRGKTTTTNKKAVAKRVKANVAAAKTKLKVINKTPDGKSTVLQEAINLARSSRALTPIEMTSLTAMLMKVVNKLTGREVKGKTDRTVKGVTTHTA